MRMLSEIWTINEFLATHPLTRRRRLSATARVLQWQIVSRIRGEVIIDWIGGTRFAARRGMTGITGNIYAGLHEFADMAFVLHFLRPHDLFVDVGANVGSYTILASGVVGCRTVAFEPDPGAAAALERNVALNRIAERVETRRAAVGDRDGIIRFSVVPSRRSTSRSSACSGCCRTAFAKPSVISWAGHRTSVLAR
jgi:hypothetical protein